MSFFTVGPAAAQWGHWKSRNSMMVIGASTGPRYGQLSMGMEYLFSALNPKEEAQMTKKNASNSFFHIVVTSCMRKAKRGMKCMPRSAMEITY
jgi:hypothetical protein